VRVLRTAQFPEDAGPMAHPVRPDSYVEINNFYTVTIYEKGAEVVRMMQTLVGATASARGMDLYFQRHDGQAVTCDDFAQAIADANPGSDLARLLPQFKRWYSQAGTPRVTAAAATTRPPHLHADLEQQRPAHAGPARQGAVRDPAAASDCWRATAARCRCSSKAKPRRSAPSACWCSTRPRLLHLRQRRRGAGAVAAARLLGAGHPGRSRSPTPHLLVLLRHDTDPFNRWEAGQRLALDRLLGALRGDARPASGRRLRGPDARVLRDPTLDAAFKAQVLTLPDEARWPSSSTRSTRSACTACAR
jgi:aminopeptidase N